MFIIMIWYTHMSISCKNIFMDIRRSTWSATGNKQKLGTNYHLYFYNIYDFLCRRTKQFQAWTKTSTAKAVSVPIKEEGGFWSYEKFQAEGNGITPACITVKTGKKISENQWNAKRLVRTQIKLWFFHYNFWYGAEIFCLCSALGIYILHRAYIF